MKKVKIQKLEVQSFVTSVSEQDVQGGATYPGCVTFTNCNTCQCSEAYTICCGPTKDPWACTGPGGC